MKLADVRPGKTVVVMGCGTIGLFYAAVARLSGVHWVILVDVLEKKLEFAKTYLGFETLQALTPATIQEIAVRMLSDLGLCLEQEVIEASSEALSI